MASISHFLFLISLHIFKKALILFFFLLPTYYLARSVQCFKSLPNRTQSYSYLYSSTTFVIWVLRSNANFLSFLFILQFHPFFVISAVIFTSLYTGHCNSCCITIYFHTEFLSTTLRTVGRDSSFGIATGNGLDGPGIESRWKRDFPHLSRPALGPT